MTVSSVSSSSGCRKCGASKKSGKHSCCAPGGAWFKNCGDAGDTLFDHTWSEGIQACKDVATSFSAKAPLKVTLRRVEVSANPPKTAQPRYATQQQTHIYLPGSMSTSATTDSKEHVGLTNYMCIYVFWIISVFRQSFFCCERGS